MNIRCDTCATVIEFGSGPFGVSRERCRCQGGAWRRLRVVEERRALVVVPLELTRAASDLKAVPCAVCQAPTYTRTLRLDPSTGAVIRYCSDGCRAVARRARYARSQRDRRARRRSERLAGGKR